METTCPAQFMPLGCWDITKAASSDSTLAGLLAVIAATVIVLVLQATRDQPADERERRNIVLSFLVSTFLSALFTSFIFGLLSGEMAPFEADVLIVLAAPALVVGALQFLLSIGWLLTLYQAGKAPLAIARWAFLLVAGLAILYLALDWADLLVLKTQASPVVIYTCTVIFILLLIGAIAWVARLKRKFSSEESERPNHMQRCAISGVFVAAGSTLLYRIVSDLSAPFLQNVPDVLYYLGCILLMTLMMWFVYVSEMSWPVPLPASTTSTKHPIGGIADQNPLEKVMPLPLEKATAPVGKKRPRRKPTGE